MATTKTQSAKTPAQKAPSTKAASAKAPATKSATASPAAARTSAAKTPTTATRASATATKTSAQTAATRTAPSARASSTVKKAAAPERETSLNAASFSGYMEKEEEPKKKGGSKKALVALCVILSLLLIGGAGFVALRGFSGTGSGITGEEKRANTLALAKKYLEKGQYDKAMDLLNGLLIQNPNDAEADELLDMAIQQKNESDQSLQNGGSQNIVVQSPDAAYNINIDTDEITNAFREQNERQQQMINDLLEQQRQQSEDRKNAEAEEKAAAKKAEAEQKKKEEAERKAKEEQLAQKNAALKKKIDGINEKIQAGEADLKTGNIDSALKNFSLAVSQLPLDEGEPAFSASKYSQVAASIYEAAQNEKDPARREKLKDAVINYVNKSLSVNPNDPVSHYILGMNYIDSGDWAKAEKELSDAVKNAPDNALYYYNLGRVQYRQKNYNGARSSFTSAVKYNKTYDSAYYNLGMTLKRLKLNKDALSAFRSAHAANPQNAKAYLEEARILNDVYKDSNGSVAAYNQVISLDPVNTSALNECGAVYSNLGQYKKAEEYHRKAVALLKPGDQDPVTYYKLAFALYNQNKLADAEKYAKISYDQKDVLKGKAEKASVTYNYALIEDTRGNFDTAINLYKEVLVLEPENAKAKTNLGKMFMQMTPPDADTALSFYQDAYKVEKSFELENNMGSAYLAKKDYPNAITHFQNALKKDPKDNAVRYNLAKAYSGSGDFDNAKTTYLELLNADSKNWDAYIDVARVFIAKKDMANAEAYLKILQQKNPTYKKTEVDKLLEATKI